MPDDLNILLNRVRNLQKDFGNGSLLLPPSTKKCINDLFELLVDVAVTLEVHGNVIDALVSDRPNRSIGPGTLFPGDQRLTGCRHSE